MKLIVPRTAQNSALMRAYGKLTIVGFLALCIVFAVNVKPAQGASTELFPSFCLGGWEHPQRASGPAEVAGDGENFTQSNSAYLPSSVGSQIYCGYFAAKNRVKPPTKLTLSIAWDMRTATGTAITATSTASTTDERAYTSNSEYLVSPDTGFIIRATPATTTTPTTTETVTPPPVIPPVTPPVSDPVETQPPPVVPPSDDAPPTTPPSSDVPSDTPPSNPTPVITPPSDSPPSDTPPPPTTDAPTSFLQNTLLLFAKPVFAANPDADTTFSKNPFLEVRYSVDGEDWVKIGSIGADNWKNYTVVIPVTSWRDLSRLQVTLATVVSIDARPDIFLEHMTAKVEFSRTIGEALKDTVAAAFDAVDSITRALLGDSDVPDEQPEPVVAPPEEVVAPIAPPTVLTNRNLLFTTDGTSIPLAHIDSVERGSIFKVKKSEIQVEKGTAAPSLTISGPCHDIYYVVLMFKNRTDFIEKPSSFVVNQAERCNGNSFTFDLSQVSLETPLGSYYLMVGEENETSPWVVTSDLFPITIQATTTITIVPP